MTTEIRIDGELLHRDEAKVSVFDSVVQGGDAVIIDNVINPLAQTLIDADFELAPMLKQLFKSEHFFDERALGVIIKSPFDITMQFINESRFFYNDELIEALVYFSGLFGQKLFTPPMLRVGKEMKIG